MAKFDFFANSPAGNLSLFGDVAAGGSSPRPYTGDITKYGYGPQHDWFGPGALQTPPSGGGGSVAPLPSPGPSTGQPDAGAGVGDLADNSGPGQQGGENALGSGGQTANDAQQLADGALDPGKMDLKGLIDKALGAMMVEKYSTPVIDVAGSLKGGNLFNLKASSVPASLASLAGGPLAGLALGGINFGAGATVDSIIDKVMTADPIMGMAFKEARAAYKKDPTQAETMLQTAMEQKVLRDLARNSLMDVDYAPPGEGFVDPNFVPGSLNPAKVVIEKLQSIAGVDSDRDFRDFEDYANRMADYLGVSREAFAGNGMTSEQFSDLMSGKGPSSWDSPVSDAQQLADGALDPNKEPSGWDAPDAGAYEDRPSFGSPYQGNAGYRDGSRDEDNIGRGGDSAADTDTSGGYDRGDSGRD